MLRAVDATQLNDGGAHKSFVSSIKFLGFAEMFAAYFVICHASTHSPVGSFKWPIFALLNLVLALGSLYDERKYKTVLLGYFVFIQFLLSAYGVLHTVNCGVAMSILGFLSFGVATALVIEILRNAWLLLRILSGAPVAEAPVRWWIDQNSHQTSPSGHTWATAGPANVLGNA